MHQPFLAEIWAEIQRNSALLFTLLVSCSLPELFMVFLSESPHSHPALSNVTGEQYWSSITLNLFLELIVQHVEHLSPEVAKCF